MKNVHFAIPEIYGESLSYYEVLRKLVKAMNEVIENYDTIPDQIAEAVKDLDASQLFSAVLNQLIHSIATDNTKTTNAVKVYKKHDLLYATFNETVNLYESLIDFTKGTETELIIGTNIREVNISELFIELRKLIEDEAQARKQADQLLKTNIDNESRAREQADQLLKTNIDNEAMAREQADTTLQNNINNEADAREQADTTLQNNINNEADARKQADETKVNKSDVLTFEEIQESTDLSGKITSASAFSKLRGLAFEYVGSGVSSGSNERRPYFDFTNFPTGIYFVVNENKNTASDIGAVTFIVLEDHDINFSSVKNGSTGNDLFSVTGTILYGSSRSYNANLLVYKVNFKI